VFYCSAVLRPPVFLPHVFAFSFVNAAARGTGRKDRPQPIYYIAYFSGSALPIVPHVGLAPLPDAQTVKRVHPWIFLCSSAAPHPPRVGPAGIHYRQESFLSAAICGCLWSPPTVASRRESGGFSRLISGRHDSPYTGWTGLAPGPVRKSGAFWESPWEGDVYQA
jgi:hypothetical protein